MHIAIIYSKYKNLDETTTKLNPNGPNQMKKTLKGIQSALEENNHFVTPIEVSNSLLDDIEKIKKPDLIINLSSGITDKRSQANIVGMLEMLDIPMLGSKLASQVIALHKELAKSVFIAHGIPTAPYQLVTDITDQIRPDLNFPLMVKPEHEGSGIGVTESSKVETKEQLTKTIAEKMNLHKQEILVEEFLPGREFTVGIIGNRELEVLPIIEMIFKEGTSQMLTYQSKLEESTDSQIPANIGTELQVEIENLAKRVYRVLRCHDFARIDFRLDKNGKPFVIELNTFPGLQDEYSFFPLLAKVAGYSYQELLNRLVEVALEPKGFQ